MTEVDIRAVNAPRGVRVDGDDTGAVVTTLTSVLYLAATPTFAIMALLTSMSGGNADMMCSAAHGGWSLGGMVPMYVLMSAFHSGPWLKRIFRRPSR
jgi:hypothetical protein